MGRLPDGEPAPADGALPSGTAADAPFGAYIHVPFCSVRCGYCDFNTYTADELRGATRAGYPADVAAELALAGRVLGALGPVRPAQTVFFGGSSVGVPPPKKTVCIGRSGPSSPSTAPASAISFATSPG